MWSIGVITYIMLVGFPPFLSRGEHEDPSTLLNAPFWSLFNEKTDMLIDAIKQVRPPTSLTIQANVNWAPIFWGHLEQAKEFVSGLLTANPDDRMTAQEALRHPWLQVWLLRTLLFILFSHYRPTLSREKSLLEVSPSIQRIRP